MEKSIVQTEVTSITKVCPFHKQTITTQNEMFMGGIETKTEEHFMPCEGLSCVFAHANCSNIYCHFSNQYYTCVGTIKYVDTEVEDYE